MPEKRGSSMTRPSLSARRASKSRAPDRRSFRSHALARTRWIFTLCSTSATWRPNPSCRFVALAKDTGYDPPIAHARTLAFSVRRMSSLPAATKLGTAASAIASPSRRRSARLPDDRTVRLRMSATETIPFVYGPEDFEVNDARILRAVRTPGVEGTAVFATTNGGLTRVVVTITGEPLRIARASLPLEAQAFGGDQPKAIRPRPKS